MTREEAIKVLEMFLHKQCDLERTKFAYDELMVWDAVKMASEALAQPEQKKGKWIVRDNPRTGWYRVTCSECGEDVTSTIPMIGFFPNAHPLWDYCPYCGAKMEVEDNGKQ